MGYLDDKGIREILNLQGSPLIDKSIADRQLEVIRKGFNHLSQPNNNVLYIADEVGLGKTYIALGIASLLRHFSNNPEHHQDVILVPKENLQLKWKKELLQFSRHNYLLGDNRVKSVIGKPTGEIVIHDQLEPITTDFPSYHLYRISSFSFGLSMTGKRNTMEELSGYFNDPLALVYLERAWELDYFKEANKALLKKLCAYIFSLSNPEIELLIVDEGHNFKSGPGNDQVAEVAARNAVAARFFGIKMNTESDKRIFTDFPELRHQIKPKVQKLLVLSATPKTYSLLELKNQLDCFLPQHILSACKKEADLIPKLSQFLIRGKMEYMIRDQRHTRNQCRFEHRNGNVEKAPDAPPIQLEEGAQAIFMGMLQFKTIRHLNQQHNGNVEMGMLAGFETFRLDAQKNISPEQEYEETRTNRVSKSQDHKVLEQLMESWDETFNETPPHPKQSVIVAALLEMMKKGEKALVFVRRVASAFELESRLLSRWEKEVIAPELKTKWQQLLPSIELDSMLNAYEDHEQNKILREHLDEIIASIADRFSKGRNSYDWGFAKPLINQQNTLEAVIKTGLYHLYTNYKQHDPSGTFKTGLIRQMSISTFKLDWLEWVYQMLKKTYKDWSTLVEEDGLNGKTESEDDSYFFNSYFQTPSVSYFKRKRIYQVDWFEPNYFVINRHFQIFQFNPEPLQKRQIYAKDQGDLKEVQEIFIKQLTENTYQELKLTVADYPSVLFKETLLTRLLTDVLEDEMRGFIADYEKQGPDVLFHQMKVLTTILRSILRNGSGFLPVFIAAHAPGNLEQNLITILKDPDSIFHLVTKELKTIVRDFRLLRAVNFPENERFSEIESKLLFQTPIKGLSGMNKSKGKWATQFRMPGFPYMLITTDIFREGEDLHTYCQNIYHYGIAWNCTDMEQRTGRIDRINSLSHRKMTTNQSIHFDNRIHVFYPYVQKTLEVNQVHRLFTSINNFVKAFDIVDSIEDDGLVQTSLKVESMPEVIDKPLHSQFEHDRFEGEIKRGAIMRFKNRIGLDEKTVMRTLHQIMETLAANASYYYAPSLDTSEYMIRAVMRLEEDQKRRGPFHIKVVNDPYPGKFQLEIAGYLFKQSSKIMGVIRTERMGGDYKVIEVEDYFALSYNVPLESANSNDIFKNLYRLLRYADQLERESTNFDLSVFE